MHCPVASATCPDKCPENNHGPISTVLFSGTQYLSSTFRSAVIDSAPFPFLNSYAMHVSVHVPCTPLLTLEIRILFNFAPGARSSARVLSLSWTGPTAAIHMGPLFWSAFFCAFVLDFLGRFCHSFHIFDLKNITQKKISYF